MGLGRTRLTLANPKRDDPAPIEVEALVGTGAVHLGVSRRVAVQLDLQPLEERAVTYPGARLSAFLTPAPSRQWASAHA